LQLKEASTSVTKTLDVDWHPDAFASHYKRGKKVAESEIDGAAVLQALRQKRDAEDWQISPLDLVSYIDASGRRYNLNPNV
jgi:hypothetical protein